MERSMSRYLLASLFWLTAVAGGNAQTYWANGRTDNLLGVSVSRLGDVNGDGHPDVIAGGVMDNNWQGSVAVLSGFDGSELYRIDGLKASSSFGQSVSGVGDWQLDGYADFAVGAPSAKGGGDVYIFSGRNGVLLAVYSVADTKFGSSLDEVPDTDGDGRNDLVVGSGQQAGSAWILTKSGITYRFDGTQAFERLGRSVAGLEDIDGDGAGDIAVGSPDFDVAGGYRDAGRVSFFSGRTGALIARYEGLEVDSHFGASVDSAGDTDGDGIDDLLVGEPDYFKSRGLVWIISGRTRKALNLFGGLEEGGKMGTSVAGLGDVDNDGRPDFAFGVPYADGVGPSDGRIEIRNTDGNLLWEVRGSQDSRLGYSVAGVGDLGGDGHPDLLAGAPNFDTSRGRVSVWFLCPASWRNYGKGWPGTNGVPELTLSAPPVHLQQAALQIGNSRNAHSLGLLFIGLEAINSPTSRGGSLLVNPLVTLLVVVPPNGATIPFIVPPPLQGGYCDPPIYVQSLIQDPGASDDISFSRGLQEVYGMYPGQ